MSHEDDFRLARGLARATIEATEADANHKAELAPLRGGQMLQHVQCPVQGRVGNRPVWQELAVTWPHPFLMAVSNGKSDTQLKVPQIATGVQLLTNEHIIIDVQIRDWAYDDSNFIVGATARVSAWSPLAGKKHDFSAIIHLSFFGYGSPKEEDTEA